MVCIVYRVNYYSFPKLYYSIYENVIKKNRYKFLNIHHAKSYIDANRLAAANCCVCGLLMRARGIWGLTGAGLLLLLYYI